MVIDLVCTMLNLDEGRRATPYKCSAGRWTIGVGRNFQDNPFTAEERELLGNIPVSFSSQKNYLAAHPLSNDQINQLLRTSVEDAITAMLAYEEITRAYLSADANRQAVLVNMAFNLGIGGLLKFKTFLDAMQRGDYQSAAEAMRDSKWFKQVGARAKRLESIMRLGILPKEFF